MTPSLPFEPPITRVFVAVVAVVAVVDLLPEPAYAARSYIPSTSQRESMRRRSMMKAAGPDSVGPGCRSSSMLATSAKE